MAGTDSEDEATAKAPAATIDYAANLAADGLRGKRIGVIRSHYGAGSNPGVEQLLTNVLAEIRAQDAEIIDDLDIVMLGVRAAETTVLSYEFKADLAAYFERSNAPFETLAQIIAFNDEHSDTVMPFFAQERMLAAEESGELDDEAYTNALRTSKEVSQASLNAAFADNRLDALIAVTNSPAWMIDHANGDSVHIGSSSYAAVSGYPAITVPAGFVSDLPIGLSFIGLPFTEKKLIEIAYAFEQAVAARRPPNFSNDVTK
jgi:amidase